MEKENNLFKCVHHSNTDLALTTAKQLKKGISVIMQAEVGVWKSSMGTHIILMLSLYGNFNYPLFLMESHVTWWSSFPRLEHNMEKVLTLTRQGIQCLKLSQNTESSGLCWLNDEVSCYNYNFVFTMRRVICVTIKSKVVNAYCMCTNNYC